jgi:hypothetical protein
MSWFKHACFVSYRHGQHAIKERCIRGLHDCLASELELLRNEAVYVDYERLKGGQFIDPNLARALYESACMVMVYHPTYFDPRHTYCAREYRAMVALEQERLALLPHPPDRAQGLIIPVILRGKDSLPEEIANHRFYEDFSKFMLADVEQSIKTYAGQIKGIAEYIHDRCTALEELTIPGDAEHFALPSEESVRDWLTALVLPTAKFPGSET